MNIRAIAFSVIAVAGTAGLLTSGLLRTGQDGDGSGYGDRDEESYEVREHAAVRGMEDPDAILPVERLLQIARQQHAGRVLEIELEELERGLFYEVEILDDSGRVWEMHFDARSGELLEEEWED